MKRPSRIDQVVHVLADKDAIGAHVIATRGVLQDAGFESDIYASEIHPEVRDMAKPIECLSDETRDRWILFHHSTGAIAADIVRRRKEPKLLDYHNVTPPSLVAPWAPWVREELELGIEQLKELAPQAFFGVAHSKFSESDLRQAGCKATTVAAPLLDLAKPDAGGPPRPSERSAERAGAGAEWLFVGRVSPHKAQHDVIKAFACYRAFFDPLARLNLVGSFLGDDYPRSLIRFAARLGLESAVTLTGSVSDDVLRGLYASSDVFVCASDHEGFCVPLVEAMQFGVPVIAYDSSAVGETVGDGGIVLEDKEPMSIATAVHKVVSNAAVRRKLTEAGICRARAFSLEAGRLRWAEVVDLALHAAEERGVA